jgi:hypothetical protein
MPLWSGLVVRLLPARFGRRLDAVRCPWSPPRCGTRPARCAVRRLYPCAVRLPDWSPHAYIRMKISAMSTRTPITNHPSPGKLMSWIGPPRITLLLPRSYRAAGSTVSRYVSNAERSIYWSPPVLAVKCQLEHGQVAVDVGLSAWELDCDALAGQPRRCSRTWAFRPATRSSILVTHDRRLPRRSTPSRTGRHSVTHSPGSVTPCGRT